MADSSSSSLRNTLNSLDGSALSIQQAASAMMKMYHVAEVAVTEWRNAMQKAQNTHQRLNILYVANEVLQTSKRNRGKQFLEAFSPVLGQVLVHICSQDPSVTEKIRRVVKIWGDRSVFSIRFVTELLQGLEKYRKAGAAVAAEEQIIAEQFSPEHESVVETKQQPGPSPKTTKSLTTLDASDLVDEIMNEHDNEDYDDGDDELFLNEQSERLQVQIEDVDAVLQQRIDSTQQRRRRRASMNSQGSNPKKRRKQTLNLTTFNELWSKLVQLEQQYDDATRTLSKIDKALKTTTMSELENMVGDELQQTYRQVKGFQNQIIEQRSALHDIAQKRHFMEHEAQKYIPWLEAGLKVDEADLAFCDKLEQELLAFKTVHPSIRNARDAMAVEKQKQQEKEAELELRRKEEEENRKFREEALRKQTESRPGMVWNAATREYQELNTEEHWRD